MNKELSFKQKRSALKKLANEWFFEFPLLADPWVLKFQRLNTNIRGTHEGICNCYTKTIILDIAMVEKYNLHTSKDILLHEIAHAIHFYSILRTKELFQHNKSFREICKGIGCKSYKAKNNTYILNMYGTYDITPEQEIAAMEAWYKEENEFIIPQNLL
jgi:hypothetical protein